MSQTTEEVLTSTQTTQLPVQNEPPNIKKETPKIRSIVVDTFTAFQKNEILRKWSTASGQAKHDDWKDYGVEINLFIQELSDRGFNIVGVLGTEGTGKSYGQKFLPPKSNIWFNADWKNPTYEGGRKEYGTRIKPTWYNYRPTTYSDVLERVDYVINKGMLDESPVAFLLGHIEDYKSGDKVKQRLKTFGRLTNKFNIEDRLEMCYYTEVTREGDTVKYYLRTQNNGLDTCRSLEKQHNKLLIENNFQLIIDSIDMYQ
jgi:hypothetical protein